MENYHIAENAGIREVDLEGGNTSAFGRHRPRRHDDEDDGSDIFEDDDFESMAGGPPNGAHRGQRYADEEKELPAHACA